MENLRVWLYLLIVAMAIEETHCQISRTEQCCQCVCTYEEEPVISLANCGGRSLEVIPSCSNITNDTNIFLLNNNNLKRIEENSFTRFPNLYQLDLSGNKLVYIHKAAFKELRNLSVLDLHDNNLVYNRTIYTPHMFQSLTRLINLSMYDNGNNGDNPSFAYPDYALSALSTLQVLLVDGLPNKTFGIGFSNLTNLKVLSIFSSRTRCNMSVITSETFKFLPHLTNISILNCNLISSEAGSFKHQKNIQYINLSDNNKLGFNGVTNALVNIHHTLEIIIISRIVVWNALCVKIHKKFAENLKNTSLKKLVANDNRIEAFESGAIPLLPKTLQIIIMRGNNFQFDDYVFEASSLTGLTYIDLTGKDTRNFHYFQGTLHSMFRLEHSSIIHNANSEDYMNTYNSRHITLPPKLTNVIYTYGQLYYNIGNMSFEANKLETINISRNLLTRWLGPIYGLEGVKNIDLSYNFAHKVSKTFFQNFPVLETLDLSYNLLGNEMTTGNVFQNLGSLHSLNLTENYIENVPQDIFSNLTSLERLILTKNRIHSLNIEISGLKHLKLILCEHNNIQWLNEYARSQFDAISQNGNITLDLSGNPIACTCDNLHFLNWMRHSKSTGKVNFGNLSNYYCYYSDGRNVTLQNMETVYNNIVLMCYNYVGYFIGMSCVFLVTLSLVTCGLLYRFRWKLRYFYYAARHRINTVTSSEQTNHNFTYDAFVSFAEEDRDFVVNELLPTLEAESNLNLNFHQRNFTAGRPIAENIIEAVKTSKRTLILLSRNFLESYWCIYELQMANMESVTTGRDVLLIVMMEDIPTRKIPTQILYHIQTDSYIQYPSEGDTDMFWRNLTDSLKER